MLQIAKILKSNGTDGGLLIGMRDIEADDINLKEPVFIEFDGLPVPFFIQDITPKGTSKAIIHLNDIKNLEDAEEMVGRAVSIDFDQEGDDEEDFIGWIVYDRKKKVGTVDGFEDIPGNPCLAIGDILIPLHEDFVVSIDDDRRELFLDLPEGLY
ncbi:MAG: hypothetical protein MJY89_08145 [Bacteroidales bacterium]|nr:hypothetical protein [Bacteroidales bacterium]